jgi:hypothetical protein
VSADNRLETVTDALTRLRDDGYTADFYATDQGDSPAKAAIEQ